MYIFKALKKNNNKKKVVFRLLMIQQILLVLESDFFSPLYLGALLTFSNYFSKYLFLINI